MTKDAQFNIRMPADLKAQLEQAATASKRSVSAETINRLHDSFQPVLDREASAEWKKLVQERDQAVADAAKAREDSTWAVTRMLDAMKLLGEAQAMNARLLGERVETARAAEPATSPKSRVKA